MFTYCHIKFFTNWEKVTDHWDDPVQYLPSSGFGWELCTGNPETCPYGFFCDCDEELPDDEPSPYVENDDTELPF